MNEQPDDIDPAEVVSAACKAVDALNTASAICPQVFFNSDGTHRDILREVVPALRNLINALCEARLIMLQVPAEDGETLCYVNGNRCEQDCYLLTIRADGFVIPKHVLDEFNTDPSSTEGRPMHTYKTIEQANENYGPLGVEVWHTARTADARLLPTAFRCLDCGQVFFPDAKKVRNRHQCPNGCNKGKTL